jgi:hypothetical protein
MAESGQHGMELDPENLINENDIDGAQQAGEEQQQDHRMDDAAEMDFDRLQREFARLSPAEQHLLVMQLPAPIDAEQPMRLASPSAPAPAPAPSAQPMQRPQERSIPPPEPSFDGSTSWPVYSIRVQQ